VQQQAGRVENASNASLIAIRHREVFQSEMNIAFCKSCDVRAVEATSRNDVASVGRRHGWRECCGETA
jgi:hypothetical protein